MKLDTAFLDFHFENNYAYYLFGDDGSVYCVNEYKDWFPSITAKKGVNYMLVNHAFGNYDENNSMYSSEYAVNIDGKDATVLVCYGAYPAESSSNFRLDVYLTYDWGENVRVEMSRFDILGGMMYKIIGESGPEEIRQELSVKFLWDIQNGEITGLFDIKITEIIHNEDDKKE